MSKKAGSVKEMILTIFRGVLAETPDRLPAGHVFVETHHEWSSHRLGGCYESGSGQAGNL